MTSAAANAALVREDVTQLFQGLVSPLEAKDIEIGIYNSAIDFASANRIPLSWQSDVFNEVYQAKARCVFANLNSITLIVNKSSDNIPTILKFPIGTGSAS